MNKALREEKVEDGRQAVRASRLAALYATMLRIRALEDAAEAASRGGVSVFGQDAPA